MRFKLTGGPHKETGEDGKRIQYVDGDIITTDKQLDVMFAATGKFERLADSDSDPSADASSDANPELAQFGTDITSIAYGQLLDTKFRVFQKGPWFRIVNIEACLPLGDKSLRRSEIDEAIVEALSLESPEGQDVE